MKRTWVFNFIYAVSLCLILPGLLAGCSGLVLRERSEETHPPAAGLVVLADPDDAYYPLADEIAAREEAPLVGSLAQALDQHPAYLLWVVSPGGLSQENMAAFGERTWSQGPVSAGILTASTTERVRELWKLHKFGHNEKVYAANASNPNAHIQPGEVFQFSDHGLLETPLNRSSFLTALRQATYLTFTGHGGNAYLQLEPHVYITSIHIPPTDGLVISTASCQTVQPWRKNSISLQFIDQGAAAYSGFLFKPVEGYLMGEFHGLPMRYTWPAFPIGHVILAQNRGARQAYASFPFHFLLGDPRLAFNAGPPYRVERDEGDGRRRRLTLSGLPAGVVPIRVEGGAGFNYVRVPGVAAAAKWDPFYNSQLQMVDLGSDKYILLEQGGGRLSLELRDRPPWYWYPADILLDSLDHIFISIQQKNQSILQLAYAGLVRIWFARRRGRRYLTWKPVGLAACAGLGMMLVEIVYVLLRLERITITSEKVVFNLLNPLAVSLLVACGAWCYLQADNGWSRFGALLLATVPGWAPLVHGLRMLLEINWLQFWPEYGLRLYNYNLGLIPAAGWGVMLALFGLIFEGLKRLGNFNP